MQDFIVMTAFERLGYQSKMKRCTWTIQRHNTPRSTETRPQPTVNYTMCRWSHAAEVLNMFSAWWARCGIERKWLDSVCSDGSPPPPSLFCSHLQVINPVSSASQGLSSGLVRQSDLVPGGPELLMLRRNGGRTNCRYRADKMCKQNEDD